MAGPDNFHSYLVSWSKIILPITALALLSSLFLLARSPSRPTEVSFAEILAMARDQRVTAPRVSGVTSKNATFSIKADSAVPDLNRRDSIDFDQMAMRMDNPDGSSLDVTSSTGNVDGNTRVARFLGLARIETSSGYQMESAGLIAELDSGTVTSDGEVEIRGPFGTLIAGQVTFVITDDEQGQQMLFTKGVHLIYDPKG
ncbi:LPS export ABC transporter periplasmic protein LptC [Yoonia sediminilitoris]|uniref:Lipopolysaccharide export system protein LptC n=1 Tax=Yoonia sediminilitoris TaxID=1286148 RepID=A0A2T6KLM9_9RHOB|nr:LPS export ABC transporter periplasmic protein LptC [Yoonia sediminilitoris]PUB17109.1 lipopolysaccharide export system protein LptC [Yoonia sediminilitoris]RCW97404.1 lipopolysaccharide export system protein LptC [Yoonia sediminilitoris]